MQSLSAVARRFLLAAAIVAAPLIVVPAVQAADPVTIVLGGPAARSLTKQGVTIGAVAPATKRSDRIALPATDAAALRGGLTLRAGARQARLRNLRVTTGKRAGLSALVGSRRVALGAIGPAGEGAAARTLTLTAQGARLLRRQLGRPGIAPGRLGTIALPAAGQAIAGGQLAWGFAAAVRTAFSATGANYNTGEPFRLLSAGALQLPDDTFGFPVSGGHFDRATGRATITTTGSLRLGYKVGRVFTDGLAHGIWITFGDLTVNIDGVRGTLEGLTGGGFHGSPEIPSQRRAFADLDLSASPAVVSPDGATVTWTGVKATLNQVGEPLGLNQYHAGYELDPLTITARLRAPNGSQEKR